ncbi:MAG TPA: hypothetical protein PLP42_13160 [Acidobacteriota bacterium]|nr:hypothetical protein [Acidobacteriota bacterium]
MKRNSSAWLWLLLLMYALYAVHWSEKILEPALNPAQNWFSGTIPWIVPTFQALFR